MRDIQPPLVTGCPHSKTVFLEPGEVKNRHPYIEMRSDFIFKFPKLRF